MPWKMIMKMKVLLVTDLMMGHGCNALLAHLS